VAELEAKRGAARERDLDDAATAIRAGSGAPSPKAEPALEKKLVGARRTRDAFERAASSAIGELEAFKRKHAGALEADAARSLQALRSKLAEKAKQTAALYTEAESAAASVKKLEPAAVAPAETGPPGSGEASRSTVLAPQFISGTSRSAGPDRGEIDRVLNFLGALGG
jgi:hypothetical protein